MTTGSRTDDTEPEALFSDESLWQSWLDVEAALARAQGRIGMIPAEAAEEIAANARLDRIGADTLRASIARTKSPILSLARCLSDAAGESGRWVHWGATTQNVIQTGRQLLIRRAATILNTHMAGVFDTLAALAEDHSETLMAGRTNRRHALPISFGFKVAGWAEELDRAMARLDDAETRTFSLSFGGAVGAHHAYGPDGPRLMEELAAELGFSTMIVPSRTVNDIFAEYLVQLSMLGMSVERIARELYALMGEEIGEIREQQGNGVVGSSTMPHKVNPKQVVKLQAACARLRAQATLALECGLSSHEGDAAANHLLAACIDETLPLACRVAAELEDLLRHIDIDTARMQANLDASGPFLAAENLMIRLARETGRSKAHDLVHHAIEHTAKSGEDVVEALLDVPEIAALGERQVRESLDPTSYLGQCGAISRQAAGMAQRRAAALRRSNA